MLINHARVFRLAPRPIELPLQEGFPLFQLVQFIQVIEQNVGELTDAIPKVVEQRVVKPSWCERR